jgi:catechol 2,3-dioxygenase-like lactoylglutathione lyase family enzyme
MDVYGVTPILNVANLEQSFAWFEKLGWRKRWAYGDPPNFGAVGNTQCEIFLCQDGQGCRRDPSPGQATDENTSGNWMCWLVGSPAEVDAAYADALRHGLTVLEPPADKPWNLRECLLRHPDGHTFRIGAGLESGQHIIVTEPKLEIERVDVPVRLEVRLAAALRDLAAHKGMTLGQCLEETLLHTFERSAGGGVASPHTESTLDYIQQLKAEHSMDYDGHASYRFVEKPPPDLARLTAK